MNILREAEAGVSARELCRKHAISGDNFYTWRKKYGGMEVPEVKRLKPLEEENADSRSFLPKPCWIRRHFRWHWIESTDDRPEAGSRGVDVRCGRSVATSRL